MIHPTGRIVYERLIILAKSNRLAVMGVKAGYVDRAPTLNVQHGRVWLLLPRRLHQLDDFHSSPHRRWTSNCEKRVQSEDEGETAHSAEDRRCL